MSDFRGIGGVSATLQALLSDRMDFPDGVDNAQVTIGPPAFSAKDADPHKEDPRVNLFLYRISENGALQNQELPGRGSPGAYGHPPLSLNLHYLLTAYGNAEIRGESAAAIFDDTTAQYLLGSAMRVLHDTPIVSSAVKTQRPPSGALILHPSLRAELELLRLSLEPLTLEDITKVWTALALRYRLSAAYVVNVVQIESRRARQFPRPVGQPASAIVPLLPGGPPAPGPAIYLVTIQTPTVTELRVRPVGETVEQPYQYARIGDTLVLRGTSLAGPITSVGIGDVVIPAAVALAGQVEATILNDLRLQPGVRTAKVIVSDPLAPQSTFASSEMPFMLVPTVDAAPVYAANPTRRLTIQGERMVGLGPGGETIIGRATIARARYLAEGPQQITVPIPDLLPTRGVQAILSEVLPDPVVLGGGPQQLDIVVAGVAKSVNANLPSSVPRADIAGILAGLIHDALPSDSRFSGVRVDLWNNRLLIVPGGLTDAITISSPAGVTFASDLGLAATALPGAGSALVSGALSSPPLLSARQPELTLEINGQVATIALAVPNSLASLAADMQQKINAASGAPAFANAFVMTTGMQLIVSPGAPGAISFSATASDTTTAAELQLRAKFAVRVRVNGAESIDPVVVELPQ